MNKLTSSAKVRKTVANVFVHILLAVLSIVWLFPILWIILISFKKQEGLYMETIFPKEYTFNNYKKLFTDRSIFDFPQMFLNTLIIAIFVCIISCLQELNLSGH